MARRKLIKFSSILILIILILSFFSGCSSNKLVGKWQNEKDVITINKDGTFKSNYYLGIGTQSDYITDGNKITFEVPLLGKEEYVYEINDDILYLYEGENDSSPLELRRVK